MSPHSCPSFTSEATSVPVTPMLRRYSIWIGESDRRYAIDMSRSAPVVGDRRGSTGTGTYPVSASTRTRLRRYSSRARCGMSEDG
jgi:hypothetical protein